MTSKPEQSGNPKKDSRNKQTRAIADRLEALGCNPIEGMVRIAMDKTGDLSIQAQMFKELASST